MALVRGYVAMSSELIVTNVRVINDCQSGVCGVRSSDCDSWVTDPAWEQEAIAATNAAEQHYFKCVKNDVKVEDCVGSSLEGQHQSVQAEASNNKSHNANRQRTAPR